MKKIIKKMKKNKPEKIFSHIIKKQEILNPNSFSQTNYTSFINTNILEVYEKNSLKKVQIYPQNAHLFNKYLSENTEIYILNPSWNTIMAMGGLEILWPFTEYLFLFSGEDFTKLHKNFMLLIQNFNKS